MTTLTPSARIEIQTDEHTGRHLVVETTWTGAALDRPDGIGFGLSLAKRALAERLVRAINAGAVFTRPEIKVDVNGATYVSSGCAVLGRRMNADLRRLGF
jgi:hypothetical protein